MQNIVCYFDGACWPKNPGGIMGWGFAVLDKGSVIHTYYAGFDADKENSNNVAEYSGLHDCMEWLLENNLSNADITIYGDSKLVIEQMSGRWKLKGGRYFETAKAAKRLLHEFRSIRFVWVPRSMNELADELSNQGVGLFSDGGKKNLSKKPLQL